MLKKISNFAWDSRALQKINVAVAKGIAGRNSREVDSRDPATWEFSGFSQNGEDGILDVLRGHLLENNRYFIEVGSSDGLENNTSWLLITEKYAGLMIEGSLKLVERANRTITPYSIGTLSHQLFVTRENVSKIDDLAITREPAIFSLDIDGNDYYVAEALFAAGFRPRIFAVEYNSAYGPEKRISIEYQENFSYSEAHPSLLYYGVSISAWRKLFEKQGYRFVTVDRNGVNAFFVDPEFFKVDFLDNIQGTQFAENAIQLRRFKKGHEVQFDIIRDQRFAEL